MTGVGDRDGIAPVAGLAAAEVTRRFALLRCAQNDRLAGAGLGCGRAIARFPRGQRVLGEALGEAGEEGDGGEEEGQAHRVGVWGQADGSRSAISRT